MSGCKTEIAMNIDGNKWLCNVHKTPEFIHERAVMY